MPGTIQINMPMKPYLRKFLLKKYGSSYKISFYSLLGKFLIEILDKQYRKTGDSKIRQASFYPLIIPKTIVEKVGFDMPPQKMKRFEEMLMSLFKSELEAHIDQTVEYDLYINLNDKKYKLDVMKAMKQFLDFYKINEDELKLESVYRDYKRQKSDVGQEKANAFI